MTDCGRRDRLGASLHGLGTPRLVTRDSALIAAQGRGPRASLSGTDTGRGVRVLRPCTGSEARSAAPADTAHLQRADR